ncbi:MAG: CPBP family intramembrane metalloprotease [Prevotella sp.]|nr:CPBP family intramembrane metalloprotease [Prevotella sp.]
MNKTIRGILDIVLYIIVFLLIQMLTIYLFTTVDLLQQNASWVVIGDTLAKGGIEMSGKMLVGTSVLSSIVTLVVFIYSKWATVSRVWLASHPWVTLVWAALLALGTILPSEWLLEALAFSMPESSIKMFESIMSEPTGYLAIGILVPVAEELVFRGAVLRGLLRLFSDKWHWGAIVVSAVIFGAAHVNMAQFVHAFVMGLLIGWMYYRTSSIIPGILFHWVNNTVAYIMFHLMPQMADGKLIDLFHGDDRMLWMGIAFSFCIIIPSIFQLHLRLRKG